MCNWAKFVNGRIHEEELALKKKAGKVSTFFCGHYLTLVIQYCMKASKVNPKKIRLANVRNNSRTIALEDCSIHQSPKELVTQQRKRVEALRRENQRGSNWNERFAGLLEQLHALSHEVERINKLKLELKVLK
jgi:hypothetical protein